MRKKSHLALAYYLMTSEGMETLTTHKKAFYWGSILPDCVPSFITTRHCIDDTFLHVRRELMRLVCSYNPTKGITSSFCRRLGVILHYVADYFTFPHNSFYPGTITDHCRYEEELKQTLRSYIKQDGNKRYRLKDPIAYDVESICSYIREAHQMYTNSCHGIDNDCTYIVQVCHNVVDSILCIIETDTLLYSPKLELAK